jgi:hypothetical protein
MKKLLLSALIAVSVFSSAFAEPVIKVNSRILADFKGKFKVTDQVKWDVTANYVKAMFVENNVTTEVFYNVDGEYIGTSQPISLDNVLTAAKRSLAKKYADYTAKEAIKFENEEETAYFISVENDKRALVLKVVNSSVSIFKNNVKK